MATLIFDQKRMLLAYKTFYGEPYIAPSSQRNTDIHVISQEMCFLLKMIGINIGDYSYSWNTHGPFSPGLLVLLRTMDRIPNEIENFYISFEEYGYILNQEARNKIIHIRNALKINEHLNDRLDWVELLGSLVYLANVELPGASCDEVFERLKMYKGVEINSIEKKSIWEMLKTEKLLAATAR